MTLYRGFVILYSIGDIFVIGPQCELDVINGFFTTIEAAERAIDEYLFHKNLDQIVNE